MKQLAKNQLMYSLSIMLIPCDTIFMNDRSCTIMAHGNMFAMHTLAIFLRARQSLLQLPEDYYSVIEMLPIMSTTVIV